MIVIKKPKKWGYLYGCPVFELSNGEFYLDGWHPRAGDLKEVLKVKKMSIREMIFSCRFIKP